MLHRHSDIRIVLKEFHVKLLIHYSTGQMIVDMYYQYSPPMAEWIADHDIARVGTRMYRMLVGISYLILYHGIATFVALLTIMISNLGVYIRTAYLKKGL